MATSTREFYSALAKFSAPLVAQRARARRPSASARLRFESLETRAVLSAAPAFCATAAELACEIHYCSPTPNCTAEIARQTGSEVCEPKLNCDTRPPCDSTPTDTPSAAQSTIPCESRPTYCEPRPTYCEPNPNNCDTRPQSRESNSCRESNQYCEPKQTYDARQRCETRPTCETRPNCDPVPASAARASTEASSQTTTQSERQSSDEVNRIIDRCFADASLARYLSR